MKKVFCVIFSLIILLTSLSIAVVAKDATTGTLANVIVCVRFSGDTTDSFATGTDKLISLYNDTTELDSYYPYDYSFKHYISEISRGLLNVENYFPQYDGTVITPLDLSRPYEYYDDGTVLMEVIDAFNSGRITLPSNKKLDYRTSGIIDNVTVILQDVENQDDAGMMWPHKSICPVQTKINGTYNIGNYNFINADTFFGMYSMTEQGTISHEFLHTVGFPDLYRGGNMSGVPVGRWDIMAANSMYQQYPLSYLRYTMGWVPMQTISVSGDYTLDAVSDDDSDRILYKLETPLSNSEFFMLEYRSKVEQTGMTSAAKKTDAKIPSSGLLIYRVNTSVEYLTNISGDDYIYVFRPGEEGLTASKGDITAAAINPLDGETSYGSADMDASFTDDTIFYSDGKNSGIVISNVSYSSDKSQISFHVEYQDYSTMDLWSNVGASTSSGASVVKGAVDDDGNKYAMSLNTLSYPSSANVYKFVDGQWKQVGTSLGGAMDGNIQTFNNELYVIYQNSSYYPVIAKLENGAWKTIATDTSSQYAYNLQIFKSEDSLYCGWVNGDGNKVIIKKINSSSMTAVNSTLTASYFSNPALTASGNYIYAVYSDFFGSDTSTKLKRYNLTTKAWENITIPNAPNGTVVHKAANNNGEVWFLASGYDTTPIVFSVNSDGTVTKKEVTTDIENILDIGIAVNDNGTLFVGLFTSTSSSEVMYLENGEWKQLGSNPCDSVQSADMYIYGDTVYVVSATLSSGAVVTRSKEMPQLPVAKILAKEGTDIEIRDGYIIGLPLNAVALSLYLDTTEGGKIVCNEILSGSQLKLYSADDILLATYTIVIRGDVNEDNVVDGTDCVLINCILDNSTIFTERQILAADADGDRTITENDSTTVFEIGLR